MIVRLQEDILVEAFDDRIVVFDRRKNLPYVLNGIGAFILLHSDGERSQEAIAQMICQEFDVGFGRALDDIGRLYDDLLQMKIVERSEQIPPRVPARDDTDHGRC
ncbi:MAG: PqqD family protein [Deltaproteobacteria bacterium]|nr:PqqD family protein [Deltaproteobacteria bacterium]